jgi:endonuclease/exonuclease/phosphatase family protein
LVALLTEIRIGTWNVQYARGAERNRSRLDVLASWKAHVWVLTETHDELDMSASHTAIRSEQRYSTPGGRWTTIWTTLPLIERLTTADRGRCVAVRLDAGEAGEVIVYGTVLPWNGDTGPDAMRPARGWDEFHRVVPEQGQEWARLRRDNPSATLVVAGDLNQDLGGRHYYGTQACRALLTAQLAKANLICLTTTDRFDSGQVEHPPIDHICAGPGRDTSLTSTADGWDNVVNGTRLSDHGGTFVGLKILPSTADSL